MKTANTTLAVPEAFDELSGERLIPFELATHKVNADGLVEPTRLRVQETLDELLGAGLIPFELTAYEVNADGPGEYIVPFYDGRIHSIRFSWKNGESFREVVRAAVLDRVKRFNSPLDIFASANY